MAQTVLDRLYSSHVPLLRAFVEVIKPPIIVELGIGNFSTAVLFPNVAAHKYVGVETDRAWLATTTASHPGIPVIDDIVALDAANGTLPPVCFVHFPLPSNVVSSTPMTEAGAVAMAAVDAFYGHLLRVLLHDSPLATAMPAGSFLFVDNFRCCRQWALELLAPSFAAVAFHDAEAAGMPYYNYRMSPEMAAAFDSPMLALRDVNACDHPERIEIPHTGFMLSPTLPIEQTLSLQHAILRHASLHGYIRPQICKLHLP